MYPKIIQIEFKKENDFFSVRVEDLQQRYVIYSANGGIESSEKSWSAMVLAIEGYYSKMP